MLTFQSDFGIRVVFRGSCICFFVCKIIGELVSILIVALGIPPQYVPMITSVLNTLLNIYQRSPKAVTIVKTDSLVSFNTL